MTNVIEFCGSFSRRFVEEDLCVCMWKNKGHWLSYDGISLPILQTERVKEIYSKRSVTRTSWWRSNGILYSYAKFDAVPSGMRPSTPITIYAVDLYAKDIHKPYSRISRPTTVLTGEAVMIDKILFRESKEFILNQFTHYNGVEATSKQAIQKLNSKRLNKLKQLPPSNPAN